MRKLLLLCLFVLCGCTMVVNQSPKQAAGPELAKQLISDTVALILVVPSKDPKYLDKVHVYCTGVFISDYTIITANHCMEGFIKQTTKTVNSKDEDDDDKAIVVPDHLEISYIVSGEERSPGMHPIRMHSANLIYHNHAQDLAILKANVDSSLPVHQFAAIAKTTPEIGEQLEMVGNVSGQYFSYRVGVVSSYRETMNFSGAKKLGIDGPFLQASALVNRGDSGGGVFNTNGELVGIASFINSSVAGLAYYVHLYTIKQAIGTIDKTNM